MTILTAPDDLRAPTATLSGQGQLRVRRAGGTEEVYPLGVGKWTIGSSARCHIKLPAAESRPIQCLVALDAGAATATRWAAGVLLNGREFAKQDLRQGDRLTIGAWELQWETDEFDKVVELVERELPNLSMPSVPPVAESGFASAIVEPGLFEAAPPAETALQTRSPRPAAKTVMVCSQKTDPFFELLGPTSSASPTSVVAAIATAPHASMAFQDRLVLDLWAANFAARRRAKSVASRAREARGRASQLAAAAAELESKIAASRTAADAQLAEHHSQIESLAAQLQRAVIERDGVAAELEALRSARPRSTPPDPRLQILSDACEAAEAESLRLRDRLAASEQQVAAWQARIAEAEAAKANSDARTADQQSHIETLGEQLHRAIAERDSATADLESLLSAPPDPRLQTLAEACSTAEGESQRLGEQLAASEQTIVALQAEIADAAAARAQADAHAADQESRINALTAELNDAVAERDRVAADLEDLQTAPPDPRLQTLAEACSLAEDESLRLGEQLAASEQTIVALRTEIADAVAARAQVDARAADQESQLEVLAGQLKHAVADRDSAAAELEALRTAPPDPRLQTLAAACAVAEAESQRLGEQLAASEQTIVALQARIAEAEVARAASDAGATDQRSHFEALAAELKIAVAERDSAAAELETLRTAPPDSRLQTLSDACAEAESETLRLREQLAASERQISELESQIAAAEASRGDVDAQAAAHAKQQAQWESAREAIENDRRTVAEEVARLSDELRASELHIERLEEQAAVAEAARAAVEQQLADQQRQQKQWLAECQILQSNHADEMADITAQRDELQWQLEQSRASAPAEAAWPSYAESSAVESSQDPVDESRQNVGHAWSPAAAEPAESPNPEFAAEPTTAEPAYEAKIEQPADEVEELRSAPQSLTHSLPATEPAEPVAPEKPFTPTSFIDKYKHLLEDESAPEPSLRQSRPILDDEYLSPKKFPDPVPTRDDDSDEALEAYMSNLMRRVRTPGVAPTKHESTLAGMPRKDEYVGPTASQELEQAESTAAAMPMETDANGMVRTVRKQPAASANLSALRELANNSARMAIAQHRQRRHAESTVSRGLIFSAAAAAAAYLILTAPGMDSPWFWGGCVALVGAAGAAAQLITQCYNRFTDVRREEKATSPVAPVALDLPAAVDAEPEA